MPTARASIIAGPGRIVFNGQTLFFQGDLLAKPKLSTFDVKTAGRRTQKRQEDVMYEISGVPNGVFAPVAALIEPYASMAVGTDIFGSPDVPLVIQSVDGEVFTYSAAALTKLPDLNLSAGKPLWGSLTFTGLGSDDTAPTAANRLLAISAAAYPTPDGYDPNAILTQSYLFSWGSVAPWVNLETEAGWTVAFNLQTSPKKTDGAGTIGMRFVDLGITAKAKPLGVQSTDVLAALKIQGTGAGRGTSMASKGQTLAITGTGVYLSLNAAAITDAGDTFSADKNRVDEITWTPSETLTNSTLNPLFFLGTAAPGS